MYDFSKVKNQSGFIEFGHDKFCKGSLENLKNIKKKTDEHTEHLEEFRQRNIKTKKEYDLLEKDFKDLRNNIKIIEKQNRRLESTNLALMQKLNVRGKSTEGKVNKVLFCFYAVSQNKDLDVKSQIQDVLIENGVYIEPKDLTELRAVENMIQAMAVNLIFNQNNENQLDRIVKILLKSIRGKIDKDQIDIDWENTMNDIFNSEDNGGSEFRLNNSMQRQNNQSFEIIVPKAIRSFQFDDSSFFNSRDYSLLRSEPGSINNEPLLNRLKQSHSDRNKSQSESFKNSEPDDSNFF